jgi:hypothetical protein
MNELRAGIVDYINFYNHWRRCAKTGGVSPTRYELALARLDQAAQTVSTCSGQPQNIFFANALNRRTCNLFLQVWRLALTIYKLYLRISLGQSSEKDRKTRVRNP